MKNLLRSASPLATVLLMTALAPASAGVTTAATEAPVLWEYFSAMHCDPIFCGNCIEQCGGVPVCVRTEAGCLCRCYPEHETTQVAAAVY